MASQAMLYARHTAVFLNQSHQQRAREQRAALGYACKPLVVNNFVAYTTNYASTVARTDQNDFWVGKIVQLDVAQGQVQLVPSRASSGLSKMFVLNVLLKLT